MADDAPLLPPASAERIAALFAELRRNQRLRIGPREQIAATRLLAELFARRAVTAAHELKPFLSPLLARTPDERDRFSRAFDRAFAPPALPPIIRDILADLRRRNIVIAADDTAVILVRLNEPEWRDALASREMLHALLRPLIGASSEANDALRAAIKTHFRPSPSEPSPPPRPKRLLPMAAAAFLVVAVGVAGYYLWPRPAPLTGVIVAPAPQQQGTNPTQSRTPVVHAASAPSLLARDAVDEIMAAAAPYSYAPTIEELSETLAPRIGWGPDGFAARLAQLSGRARDTPLPLVSDSMLLARVALAVALIDTAGDRPTIAQLTVEADRAAGEARSSTPYLIETEWVGPDGDSTHRSAQRRSILENIESWLEHEKGRTANQVEILRGLSLWAQRQQRIVSLAQAPWRRNVEPSSWPWAPFALALLPLVFSGFWIAHGGERRKAYLRRRAPRAAFSVSELVAGALEDMPHRALVLSRAAQQLQAWTDRADDRLDIARTIETSLLRGKLTPVPARLRAQPDYLLLIESDGRGDQDTVRLRALAHELEKRLLHVSIYYFRSDPAWLHRENREARAQAPFLTPPIAIEELAARTEGHRLVVISAGEGFLNPIRGAPARGAATLTRWPTRAMLTPTPMVAWGAREQAIARALDMPIGRATEDGLLGLATLLGLASSDSLYAINDAPRARALPETFRTNRHGWSQDDPPEASNWLQLKQMLMSYLDPAAYDWLAACAIYPEIRWDLTLFLGLALEGPGGGKLHREDRFAALTALPWFRTGRMPDWLRKHLIEDMRDRAEPIRELLRKLVEPADEGASPQRHEQIRLPIAREDGGELGEALQDAIFIDFLAKGRITDLDLRVPDPLRRRAEAPRDFALDAGAAAAALIGATFAVLAFVLAPRGGQLGLLSPASVADAPPNGAWLPALGSVFAAPIAMLISDSTPIITLWRRSRASVAIFSFASAFCALALAGVAFAFAPLDWLRTPTALVGLAGLTSLAIVAARRVAHWCGIACAHPRRPLAAALDLVAKAIGLASLCGGTLLLWPIAELSEAALPAATLAVVFALVGFAAAPTYLAAVFAWMRRQWSR